MAPGWRPVHRRSATTRLNWVAACGAGSASWGALPDTTGALSAAVIVDQIMRARVARRGRGAVIDGPGVLPSQVRPELQIQPPWVAGRPQVELAFDRADELLWLQQECPQLASAGMLTLGYGKPRTLIAAPAAAAAAAAKRPFGLWRATLPPANTMGLPQGLPLPHPKMRARNPCRSG